MGRKYRALKEALRTNAVRDLMVIDDRKLRLQLCKEGETLRKKIDKLELEREHFASHDQRLFNDWMELTFRTEKQQLEGLRQEYHALARFHNDLISVIHMQDISPPEAYGFLKAEEQRYEIADQEERQRIDKLRQERREFTRKSIEQEQQESQTYEDSAFDESELDSLDRADQKFHEILSLLPAENLKAFFSAKDGAILATNALLLCLQVHDISLLLKIWAALSPSLRSKVSKNLGPNPISGDLIEDVIQEIQDIHDSETSQDKDESETDEFFQISGEEAPAPSLSEGDDKSLKSTFRRLARLIHPDSQDAATDHKLKEWYNKTWGKIQKAYTAKNVRELKKLEILAMIQLKNLNSLTIDDIKASTAWIKEELAEANASVADLKRHPAWRFSRKRTYETLIKKIRKDFERDQLPLRAEIEEMKSLHEIYAYAFARNQSRKSPRKKSGSKPRVRKSRAKQKEQMSFF